MEIGALICRPINPKCDECPISEKCYALNKGNPENFPTKSIRKSKPQYDVVVAIIWRNNKFYIQKRETDKMLGGLWEFPGGMVKKGEDPKIILRNKDYTYTIIYLFLNMSCKIQYQLTMRWDQTIKLR